MGAPTIVEPPLRLRSSIPVMRPRMGEAMAVPEPVEPLVPCDPRAGFAPPPPDVEPPSMRMGDWGSGPVEPVEPPKKAPVMGDHVDEPVTMGEIPVRAID
jgi:hypothetical protein